MNVLQISGRFGDIRLFSEDLLSLGISVLNLQDLVNGLDWIKENRPDSRTDSKRSKASQLQARRTDDGLWTLPWCSSGKYPGTNGRHGKVQLTE